MGTGSRKGGLIHGGLVVCCGYIWRILGRPNVKPASCILPFGGSKKKLCSLSCLIFVGYSARIAPL